MAFKGAIFDLDGVLVDTVPLHFKAWQKMFNHYGYDFDWEDYEHKVDGKPRVDGAKAVLVKETEEQIEEACTMKQGFFLEMINQGMLKAFDTSLALLQDLKAHNIVFAAASSSKNAPLILEKLGIISDFETVVTSLDIADGRGKPNPDIFLTAAGRIGVPVEDCIVFEDAKSGVQAAKAGNFYCVGIDRHNNRETFKTADFVVTDLGELSYEILKSKME